MFFKYVFLDLDDTLYSYHECHSKALFFILEGLSHKLNIKINEIQDKYDLISKSLKYELLGTASCHNKGIYIKQLLEGYNIDLGLSVLYEKSYWKIFYENLKCYDGVYDFIKWLKNNNIGVVIVTDYEKYKGGQVHEGLRTQCPSFPKICELRLQDISAPPPIQNTLEKCVRHVWT